MNIPSLDLGNDSYMQNENSSSYVTLGPEDFYADERESQEVYEAASVQEEEVATTALSQEESLDEATSIADIKQEEEEVPYKAETEVFFADEENTSEVESNEHYMEEEIDVQPFTSKLQKENSKETQDEVIRLPEEDTDIEGLPYSRDYKGRPVKKAIEKEALFGTEKVAQMLGTTAQTIRDYCDNFDFYLNIARTEKGARRFTAEDIEKLRYIMKLKEEKQFTVKEMQQYLRDPEHFTLERNLASKGTVQLMMEELADRMSKQMAANMEMIVKQTVELSMRAIEQKDKQSEEIIGKMDQRLKQQEESLNKLIKQIQEATESSSNKDKEYAEQIDSLLKMIEEKEKAIEALRKESGDKDLQIIELQNNAKPKKFFGLFG